MAEKTLPLGTQVTIRGMNGFDEDVLSNQKKLRSGEAINEVLANCTQRLVVLGKEPKTKVSPADIARLKTPDRSALLIEIRRETYGDDVLIDIQCPLCREKFAITQDLSKLETRPAPQNPDGTLKSGPYSLTLELPDLEGAVAPREVQVDLLDGRLEQELMKTKENLMTMSMFLRIKAVEGVHQNKVFDWLQSLPSKTRKSLRTEMAKFECGVEEDRTADCTGCGEEVSFNAIQQPRFFFPAE